MARVPPPAPAPDSPLVGARVEDCTGGVEVAAPVALSPELFSPLPELVSAESGEASLSPSLEAAALPTTSDLATPAEWGDSNEPAGDGAADWVTKPVRKRPLRVLRQRKMEKKNSCPQTAPPAKEKVLPKRSGLLLLTDPERRMARMRVGSPPPEVSVPTGGLPRPEGTTR
ncbi:hypothetical protein AAFF_G00084360 [Aldrovandia affinis]|uniref:Uncharacterized protein n=1 Tax=Aldrovandia affinis TaxID=143900 RepID=A0AAD7VXL9_9TELE|nr:hypothetical protein AAFF_G00084360 [Aldrovandia affinis]